MDWRDVLYPVYNKDQIEEYAFTLCIRSDGSYYGTAEGNKCRQGTETSRAGDKEVTRDQALDTYGGSVSSYEAKYGKKLGKVQLSAEQPEFKSLSDAEFANVVNNSTQILSAKPAESTVVITLGDKRNLEKPENVDFLKRLEKDPSVINERLRDVSDKELEASWALLPKSIQNKISSAAATKGTALQEDGTLGSPNPWRGKQLYKRWLQQDGKDLYTGAKLNFFDADMEHIRGVKTFGIKKAEKVENYCWIRRTVNQDKKEKTISQFLKSVNNRSDEETVTRWRDSRDKARQNNSIKQNREKDAKMLAEMGYSVYKKYGNNKIHLIMTDIGITNRITAERAGGRTSSHYFLKKNLPKGFSDPDGKRVSAQGWIALNWGNYSPAQRTKIQNVINNKIQPKMSRNNDDGSWDKAQKEVEDLLLSMQ